MNIQARQEYTTSPESNPAEDVEEMWILLGRRAYWGLGDTCCCATDFVRCRGDRRSVGVDWLDRMAPIVVRRIFVTFASSSPLSSSSCSLQQSLTIAAAAGWLDIWFGKPTGIFCLCFGMHFLRLLLWLATRHILMNRLAGHQSHQNYTWHIYLAGSERRLK